MRLEARPAGDADIEDLVRMYRRLQREMTDLHPMWPRADGLPEPIEEALMDAIEGEAIVVVGEMEDAPVGFLFAEVARSLPQADHEEFGVIRYVFTEPEAREVGVAEAMRDAAMETLRARGITKFDAHVLPGHRLAKNFFEAGGFSARSIVMHHDDHPQARPGRDARRF